MEPFEVFEVSGIAVELFTDYDAGDPYREYEQASALLLAPALARDWSFPGETLHALEDRSTAVCARWLTLCGGYALALPFRFEDRGSSGARAYLTDTGDNGASGFVVMTADAAREEWPDNLERAENLARGEFATWSAYIAQDVCGWRVAAGTPEEDSCWGFYGPDADKYAREEATAAAGDAARERAVRHARERMYALDPDANPYAL